MLTYFQRLLGERGLAPHGYCLLWDPALIWTHVVSDALIGIAYFSIPIAIAYFLTRRRDVAFGWVVWMFAAFIMACGTTHFLSIWVLWHPDYGIEALVKAFTAIVSVITAVALWPLLPRAIALPSPAQLQRANDDLSARIAERDAALAALHRAKIERERAEEMLRQSQKMEAVGQLTGGIAHDFNNLLTIVIANLDRARRLTEDDPRLARTLDNARAGSERAARLTAQLLAFARRQPLLPSAHDVNTVIADVRDLVAATLPPEIALVVDLAADVGKVEVDSGQLENALVNLVVNARDAMPAGGTLTIRSHARAGPDGPQAVIDIIDSGTGMSPDVAARAFEPFFTTKDIGRGSGLGLSQVYGFVRQSGGTVMIDSVVDAGTTISIILPQVRQAIG